MAQRHVQPAFSLCLPWIFCLVVLASTSAIRGLRMPAESAAGRAKYFKPQCRYMSSGVVQRSVSPPIPAVSAPMMEMMNDEGSLDSQPGGLQAGAGGGHWLGLGKRGLLDDDEADDVTTSRFTPYVSVGVLSNMQQFFDTLKNNLDSLEDLPAEEKDLLLGRTANGETIKHPSSSEQEATRRRTAEHNRASRPTATAAYLHALRSHRPSHKLRNFVAQVEPTELRGTNMYDPAWMWTGLGRRRR